MTEWTGGYRTFDVSGQGEYVPLGDGFVPARITEVINVPRVDGSGYRETSGAPTLLVRYAMRNGQPSCEGFEVRADPDGRTVVDADTAKLSKRKIGPATVAAFADNWHVMVTETDYRGRVRTSPKLDPAAADIPAIRRAMRRPQPPVSARKMDDLRWLADRYTAYVAAGRKDPTVQLLSEFGCDSEGYSTDGSSPKSIKRTLNRRIAAAEAAGYLTVKRPRTPAPTPSKRTRRSPK